MRRALLAALASLLLYAGTVVIDINRADAATYRVVGTGDSILDISRDYVLRPGRWIDVEQGRNAYTPGLQGRHSTASIWPHLLAMSERGGWVIIQDNGLGPTIPEWRALMDRIVRELPDDRCLLGVLPVFHPAFPEGAKWYQHVWAANREMVQAFEKQPCVRFARWDLAVLADPSLTYDGQHPTEEGAEHLGELIDEEIGS